MTHDDACPYCGHSIVPTDIGLQCLGDDRHLFFDSNDWDLDRAKSYVITFGKHKGKPMDKVDRGYLKWITENFEPDRAPRRAAEAILRYETS